MTAAAPVSMALVTPRGEPGPYGAEIVKGLSRQGVQVLRLDDGDPALMSVDVVLLLGYFPRLARTAAQLRQAGVRRPVVVAWAYEPLVPDDIAPWAERLSAWLWARARSKWAERLMRPGFWPVAVAGLGRWSGVSTAKEVQFAFGYSHGLRALLDAGLVDVVACSTGQRAAVVSAWGFAPVFAPLSFQASGPAVPAPAEGRDIDVLFLGRLSNPWRRARLRGVLRVLRAQGARVEVVTRGLRGAERDAVLDRCRVVLHLAKYPWDTAWMRFYLAAARGVVVASEPLHLPDPMRPGIDYLEAPVPDLAKRVLALLADEPARRAMAETARARIAAKLDFDDSLHQIMAAAIQAKDNRSGR